MSQDDVGRARGLVGCDGARRLRVTRKIEQSDAKRFNCLIPRLGTCLQPSRRRGGSLTCFAWMRSVDGVEGVWGGLAAAES